MIAELDPTRAYGPYLQRYVCDIIQHMTESVEPTGEPARIPEEAAYRNGVEGPSRLVRVAAVVGIVAGVVFVVAVVFFAGFFLGGNRGGYGGPDGWRDTGQMGPGGRPGTCPMMGPGGMMGPGAVLPTPVPPTPRP